MEQKNDSMPPKFPSHNNELLTPSSQLTISNLKIT